MTDKTTKTTAGSRGHGRVQHTPDPPSGAPDTAPAAVEGAPAEQEQPGAEAAGPGVLAQAERTVESWASQLLSPLWSIRLTRATSTIFVDEWREGAEWVVEAEIPGVDPDRDVTLRLDRHALELQADRRSTAAQHATSMRRELRSGRLTRTLPVPRGVDPARAHATYRDGVVTVRVPFQLDDEDGSRELPVTRD